MSNDIHWGIERRLEFIEHALYWDGRINRKDIMQAFGVSMPQASADLKRYQELAPHNLVYDSRKKYYCTPDTFQSTLLIPNAEQYLSNLLNQTSDATPTIGYATLPHIKRALNTHIVRHIIHAMRHQHALEIQYQSFTQSTPTWRWIAPHALGFANKRWHCRAYCENHYDFRDFILGRILAVRTQKPYEPNAYNDQEWHTNVTLHLAPNPLLSHAQQQAVEREYSMQNGVLQLSLKAALLHYFLNEYGLTQDPPSEKQEIVLLNRAQIFDLQNTLRTAKG